MLRASTPAFAAPDLDKTRASHPENNKYLLMSRPAQKDYAEDKRRSCETNIDSLEVASHSLSLLFRSRLHLPCFSFHLFFFSLSVLYFVWILSRDSCSLFIHYCFLLWICLFFFIFYFFHFSLRLHCSFNPSLSLNFLTINSTSHSRRSYLSNPSVFFLIRVLHPSASLSLLSRLLTRLTSPQRMLKPRSSH